MSTTERDVFTHKRANLKRIKHEYLVITLTATLLNLLWKFEKLAGCFSHLYGPSAFCRGKQRRETLFKCLSYLHCFTR